MSIVLYIFSFKCFSLIKSKIPKILNSEEIQNRKLLFKWQDQKLKHIKRMDNICPISDLVQAFSYKESGGLDLVL